MNKSRRVITIAIILLVALVLPIASQAGLIENAYSDVNTLRAQIGLKPFKKTNALLVVAQIEADRIARSRKLEPKQFTTEYLSQASGLTITAYRAFVVRGKSTAGVSDRIKIAEAVDMHASLEYFLTREEWKYSMMCTAKDSKGRMHIYVIFAK